MKKTVLNSAIAAAMLALTACGGSSSDSDGTITTSISGTASAPGGSVAYLKTSDRIMMAVGEFFLPSAHAGFTGLEPVTGATVELIRIDDNGNQVGEVLATTTTSVTGEYTLALPEGVSLAGNLFSELPGRRIHSKRWL